MFGVKESEGAKWFQSGQKEFKKGLKETKLVQVELELVEGSKITSKCVKIKMKADKLEFTQGIFLRDIDLLKMPSCFSYIRFFTSCFSKMTAKWHLISFLVSSRFS